MAESGGMPAGMSEGEAMLGAMFLPLSEMPDPLPIPSIASLAGDGPYSARVRVVPPGSKSLTNRVLLLAALAEGVSVIHRPLLEADDAQRMLTALGRLGVKIDVLGGGERVVVEGCGGRFGVPRGEGPLFLNNAGTATRFLTAAAVLSSGWVGIDGNARMRERPIGELVGLLRSLGVEVEEEREAGFVPLRIKGTGGVGLGGEVVVGTTQSSQFVSALCMVAPWLEGVSGGRGGLTIRFDGEITSRSYVEMTLGLMREVGGVEAVWSEAGDALRIEGGGYGGFEYEVEPDASGATYPWAAAALLPGVTVRVPGLAFTSLQSDARFLMPLRAMGCGIEYAAGAADCVGRSGLAGLEEVDFEATPDAAMTLAAVAAFAEGETLITGLRTLRVKETDRLEATRVELGRVGVGVETTDETMRIVPPAGGLSARAGEVEGVVFETYDDHRMAMSMSLVAMRLGGCAIGDPGCVAKTYPGYFADLGAIYEGVMAGSAGF